MLAALFFLPVLLFSQETLPAAQQPEKQKPEPSSAGKAVKPQRLKLGKAVEREMRGGETHIYRVHLKAGQFLEGLVRKKGIEIAVTLVGPAGGEMTGSDTPNGAFGPESWSAIAEISGEHEIRLIPSDKDASPGRYSIEIVSVRSPKADDITKANAYRTVYEAEQLYLKSTPETTKEALAKLDSALTLWQSLHDLEGQAAVLTDTAKIHFESGDNQKAISFSERALPLWRTANDRSGEARALTDLGIAYLVGGDAQKALDAFLPALPILRDLGDRTLEAQTLENMGVEYAQLGQRKEALDSLEQSLKLRRENGNPLGKARSLNALGEVYAGFGEMKKSYEYFVEALPLWRASGDRNGEAITLDSLGNISNFLGDTKNALAYLKDALPARRAVHDAPGEARTLSNIGIVYLSTGDAENAVKYFQQALSLQRTAGDRSGEAATLNNLGGAYDRLGQAAQSLDYYTQALTLWRAAGDHPDECTALTNIGTVYFELGEKEKALEYFKEVAGLLHAGDNRENESVNLNNLAQVYNELGDKDKALTYFQQAQTMLHELGRKFMEATTLSNIGHIYYDKGNKEKALDYYSQALKLEQEVNDRHGQAGTLNDFGAVYTALHENEKALEFYGQAIVLSSGTKDPVLEGAVLESLMRYWKHVGRPSAAIVFGKEAVNRYQGLRRNISGLDSEIQKDFLKQKEKAYRELADLLIDQGRLTEAEQVLDLLKKQEYFDFIRRDGKSAESLTSELALSPADRTIDAEYREAIEPATRAGAEWAELRAMPSRTPQQEQRLAQLNDQLSVANQAIKKLWDDLYAQYGKTTEARSAVNRIQDETSDLQSLLRDMDPGTVALYTLLGDDKYRVLVITPNTMVDRSSLISKGKLRHKVFDFRQALQNPNSNPLPSAQDLYKVLVEPVRKDLDGARAKTLVWILDDDLRYVPMAALHDGKEYLAEQYQNVTITRAIVSRLKDKADVTAWRGVGLGVSKSYEGMQELPAVPKELHAVIREGDASSSGGVVPGKVMLDEAFTLGNMTKVMEQKLPLLHIASHFVFSPGDETHSFLVTGGERGKDQSHRLTLADIRQRPEISFDHAELLALSGCETAVGEMQDESTGVEIDGLAQIAQRKGAKAVLASLWSVNDDSTGQLMADFYRRWINSPGITKAEALREAQVAMLHGGAGRVSAPASAAQNSRAAFSHPYYWAPFILIGNWQ